MLRFGLALGASAAVLFAAVAVVAPITFDEIADRAGVHFIADSSPTPQKHQPEVMVGGVAIFDYNGDGYPDLYFVNGADMPSLEKNAAKYKNRLFRNNHDMTFTDVTDAAGMGGAGYGMGVAVGDYDNDGWPDLYVTNVNGNQLFHNNGNGTFTDVTAKAGVGGGVFAGRKMWSVGAAWVDYNRDGLLDLFVSNYCQWDPATEQVCEINGNRVACNPAILQATAESALSQQRRWNVHRCLGGDRHRRRIWAVGWAWASRTMTATDGRISSWRMTICRISSSTIWPARSLKKWRMRRAWRCRKAAMWCRGWASISAICLITACRISG